MGVTMREIVKACCRAGATLVVLPVLASFAVRSRIFGRDRALEGSSQLLALLPGVVGQYLRRAFLARVLAGCHPTATIEFGTLFSQAGARLDARAYVGPRCHLGLVHVGEGALLAAGVHAPSGARTHGFDDVDVPIHAQPGERRLVRIGAGAWIGSAAVIMADVGRDTIVGAGAVVTRPLGDGVVAGGVPARVIRLRRRAVAS